MTCLAILQAWIDCLMRTVPPRARAAVRDDVGAMVIHASGLIRSWFIGFLRYLGYRPDPTDLYERGHARYSTEA
jgi:hypothetical protein